jgi:hypothetical protein
VGIPQLIPSTEFAGTYISALNCVALLQLFEIWGTPQINLFTSAANHRLTKSWKIIETKNITEKSWNLHCTI